MVFLIRINSVFFIIGLLLEALGGAGLVLSFRGQRFFSIDNAQFRGDIDTLILGIASLCAGILFHFIFLVIKKYAQRLEDDLFESKYSYSPKPVQKEQTVKPVPSHYETTQSANRWSSEEQSFTGNAQPHYDTQQQQRFQSSYQYAAQQTYSPQNQQLHPQTTASTKTVKPAQQKGVYNAYYVPQQSSLLKEKDFDKLLDDEDEFKTNKKGLVIKVVIGALLFVLIIFVIKALV